MTSVTTIMNLIINGKTYEPKDAVLIQDFPEGKYAIVFRDMSILWKNHDIVNYTPNGKRFIKRDGLMYIQGAGSKCDFVESLNVEGDIDGFKTQCQGR